MPIIVFQPIDSTSCILKAIPVIRIAEADPQWRKVFDRETSPSTPISAPIRIACVELPGEITINDRGQQTTLAFQCALGHVRLFGDTEGPEALERLQETFQNTSVIIDPGALMMNERPPHLTMEVASLGMGRRYYLTP